MNSIILSTHLFRNHSLPLRHSFPPRRGSLSRSCPDRCVSQYSGCGQRIHSNRIEDNYSSLQLHKHVSVIAKDTFAMNAGQVQRRPSRLNNTSVPINEILRTEPTVQIGSNVNFHNRQYSTVAGLAPAFTRGVTKFETEKARSDNILEYFKNRKFTCSEFSLKDVGKKVQVVGWIDGKNRNDRFLVLRDGYGGIQFSVENVTPKAKTNIQSAHENTIVLVTGTILARPADCINMNLDTGTIEVAVEDLKVLNPDDPYKAPEAMVSTESSSAEYGVNRFTNRTYNCGELRASHADQNVILCGWLEFSRMNKFFTLRDGYGTTQVVIPDELSSKVNLNGIAFESILRVEGTVMTRPIGQENSRLPTGHIEVVLKEIQVLNDARSRLPIDLKDHNKAKESLQMEHRYIALRSSQLQRNLRLRSQIIMKMREYMINKCGFVEIETPTLFRRTPGGAQEFVVPTRKPGHFYSLVQSPQQFKQMLMSGAIDRYFQVARCYRDEATRPDRQPEFTQLDIELSFTDREKIMSLVEGVLVHSWPAADDPLQIPFPRMTYDEAMKRFGCDKPDTRFGYEMQDVTSQMELNEKLRLGFPSRDYGAYAIVAKEPHSGSTTSLKKALNELSKQHKNSKFVFSHVTSDWLETSIVKLLDSGVADELKMYLSLKSGDLLFLGYGEKSDVQEMMGKVRLAFYENLETRGLVDKRSATAQNFYWVVDFPMFELSEETGTMGSVHHPFTAPHPEDLEKLNRKEDLREIRSQSFDLVWNGVEIGGGSVRIHNSKLQKLVLDEVLQFDRSHLKHLLDALECGCPPHGGFAIGLDRYIALLCNARSIRDVIAFPKTLDGKDLLSKAPVPISEEEKKMYHISVQEKVQC